MKSDDNTAKTLTPEDAISLDRAIASRPASPPRGYMVQGEVQELKPEGGADLEVVAFEGLAGTLYPVGTNPVQPHGSRALTPLAPAQARIRELEEWNGDLRDRVRELEEDGGHQKERIRELEEWKRSRVDLEVEARKLSQQVDELEGEVLELEGSLGRLRPVVRAALAADPERVHDWFCNALDALTPADRQWAKEGS